MDIEFKGDEIRLNREPSILDSIVADFAGILTEHRIKHVLVSGHVLFGGSGMNEEVIFLVHSIAFEKFLKLWLELERTYDCTDTDDPIDAYNGYLRHHHKICLTKKGRPAPGLCIRFVKNEIDRASLKFRRRVRLDDKLLFISPLEIQIPYGLRRGSEKDIKDAKSLFKRFKKELNKDMFEKFLTELNIPKESVNKYLTGEDDGI